MEQVIALATLIERAHGTKRAYIALIEEDVKSWSQEKGVDITQISFHIDPPDYEIGESDFTLRHLILTIDGEVIKGEYMYDSSSTETYSLYEKWETVLEELKNFIRKQTEIYEEKTGLYNLLEHLEDVSFYLEPQRQ